MVEQVNEVLVRRCWAETPYLTGLVLEADPAVVAKYTRPGQVIVLQSGTQRVHLAIASSPGEAFALEVLLSPTALQKLGVREGQSVAMSDPLGPGFPVEMADGNDVLVFAVGSAIASVRPLIEWFRRNRERYGDVRAYLGARSEQDFPYRLEYPIWQAEGIEIVQSISKPYVQDRFLEDPPPRPGAVAYVSGMKAMIDGCTLALASRGLPLDRIGRNW